MKVAVIGSGIAGLAAAHCLAKVSQIQLTLLEAGSYFGGHTHTVDVTLPTLQGAVTHGVDTGFLVFNERTYPQLIALLKELDVAVAKSDMSFSVQALAHGGTALEWSGSSLGGLFAQRRNLLNPRFYGMLRDILRFNVLCTRIAREGQERNLRQPLGDFLQANRFGPTFCEAYFLPMMACIWSCPTRQMLQFPVATMVRFCHNHGLLQITNRPQWWTVQGGAQNYVKKIVQSIADKRLNTPVLALERGVGAVGFSGRNGGVWVTTPDARAQFDKVIVATHSDQALALLNDPSHLEEKTLRAIPYQQNHAVLHTDASVLPKHQAAWAAWNYDALAASPHAPGANGQASADDAAQVCLHYLLNQLQPLPWQQPVVVSLNPQRPIDPQKILGEYDYSHPVFDLAAVAAQRDIPGLQGQQGTYFCGAWAGFGFHEDGLKSGFAAASQLLRDAGLPVSELVPESVPKTVPCHGN